MNLHSIVIADQTRSGSPWIEACLSRFAAVYPASMLKLYSDETLRQFICDGFDGDVVSAYDRSDTFSKSQLGRYCLLFDLGGVYSDPGLMFLARVGEPGGVEALHAFRNFDEAGPGVSVSLIAAPAKVVLFQRCIERFVELTRREANDAAAQGSRLLAETIALSPSSAMPAINWGDEIRLPSRPGVLRQAYKSATGAFVAVRQMRESGEHSVTPDTTHLAPSNADDVAVLLSMLDGWI